MAPLAKEEEAAVALQKPAVVAVEQAVAVVPEVCAAPVVAPALPSQTTRVASHFSSARFRATGLETAVQEEKEKTDRVADAEAATKVLGLAQVLLAAGVVAALVVVAAAVALGGFPLVFYIPLQAS